LEDGRWEIGDRGCRVKTIFFSLERAGIGWNRLDLSRKGWKRVVGEKLKVESKKQKSKGHDAA
jgi:hypothetical protein